MKKIMVLFIAVLILQNLAVDAQPSAADSIKQLLHYKTTLQLKTMTFFVS